MQHSPQSRSKAPLALPYPGAFARASAFVLLAKFAILAGSAGAARGSESDLQPSYHRDIAPIVQAHCMACHRTGESAPFPLTSYEEVSRRALTIRRVVNDRAMPPWHANPETTDFLDVRRLDDGEIALINRWIEAGRPEGDPAEAPEPPSFPEGWHLGEPDLVLSMAEAFPVPAEGADIYRNFVIPLGLDEDKWVKAVELRPSARSVVHHTLFFLDDSGEARKRDGADGKPGFGGMSFRHSGSLGAYVPGATPRKLPGDFARALPKGTDLILAHHFHPSGRAELEASTVGIYFAEAPPERRFEELQVPPHFGRGMNIDIPADEREYVVEDRFTLPSDVQVVTVSGHAHYLGRTMLMTATLPDGSERILLDIPDWDLNWQDTYHFAGEVVLPAGTVLHSRITYDNSENNPNNPHSPPRRVKWGRESTDEMGSITLGGVVLEEGAASLRQATRRQGAETLLALAREFRQSGRGERLARVVRALDRDGDGVLSADELPERHRAQLLKHFDKNGDGALDAEELAAFQDWVASLAEDAPSPSPETTPGGQRSLLPARGVPSGTGFQPVDGGGDAELPATPIAGNSSASEQAGLIGASGLKGQSMGWKPTSPGSAPPARDGILRSPLSASDGGPESAPLSDAGKHAGASPADRDAPAIEVLLFVAVDCPIANSYAPEINRLHADYAERGVTLSLIYPESTLEDAEVEGHREKFSLDPEGHVDREHREVRRAGATVTPEAAVFDREGALRYRGRIDDLYADYRKRRREPTERTLREVLDRLLADEAFEFFETEALGCFIEPLP